LGRIGMLLLAVPKLKSSASQQHRLIIRSCHPEKHGIDGDMAKGLASHILSPGWNALNKPEGENAEPPEISHACSDSSTPLNSCMLPMHGNCLNASDTLPDTAEGNAYQANPA